MISFSTLRELIRKKFDFETFKDNLLANNHKETFSNSELMTSSKTSSFRWYSECWYHLQINEIEELRKNYKYHL